MEWSIGVDILGLEPRSEILSVTENSITNGCEICLGANIPHHKMCNKLMHRLYE